jgi:hypothetical protein
MATRRGLLGNITSGNTLASIRPLPPPPPGDPAKSRALSRRRAAAKTRDTALAAVLTMRACASSWFSHAWEVSSARWRAYCAWRGSACGTSLAKPPPCFRLDDAWQFRHDAWTRGRLGACEQAFSSQPQARNAAAGGTEAAASAASTVVLTAVAVRAAAGMTAVAATALLAARVEWRGVVW